jgi:hypothetical protein
MRRIVTLVLATSCMAAPGRAQTNLCSLLPQADVSSVLATPVRLSEGAIETNTTGAVTLRTQTCNYDPPGGIGSGPATVRVTITNASSPSAAAQLFKVESQTLRPMVAGEGQPLSGVGDEAVAFPKPGSIYMRKKNLTVDISVKLRDLNRDREVTLGKELATKAASRIQ